MPQGRRNQVHVPAAVVRKVDLSTNTIHMKTYRVHVSRTICADVVVEALDAEDAENQALLFPDLDWSEPDIFVTEVVELDASGTK